MMRTASRIAQLILIALAVQAAGAERVHARIAVAAADAVSAGERATAIARATATLEATDGGAPLPFLGADDSTSTESLQTLVRAARSPRQDERSSARPAEFWRSAPAMTRARAQALAYLDYSLALLQRRTGIPTNHTTAPPPHNC